MGRLINTADLYNEIMKNKDELGVLSVYIVNWFESIVRCVPTAEEHTAEWKLVDAYRGIYVCSNCKIRTSNYAFCPNCGAKMKGESE